ncbi:radical SAM protein [Marinobacterium weihaiense]|uniref:Radical SAM protein n=1 Tax=Marinobacterium weihaiense TaxID=2851016 RepID=A0ABS6M6C8_9GAMM|nr:radical SAM protein [Marinobacterium weihaiense]MBV0931827.1 radical SAM protein [Marinobacterium weihaiense]
MYHQPPFDYIEPVFRPPSEADSLILQVTNGCSWNRCTFCDMYTDEHKRFRPKAEADVIAEIQRCGASMPWVRRVFLADGDAMALSVRRLSTILQAIKTYLPNVRRVSAYCLPSNLKNKTVAELAQLRELGLSLMYMGAESGCNRVLEAFDKGETFDSTAEALLKAKEAGMKRSVMLINGAGGRMHSESHARESARLVNLVQPEYLATLVLFFRRDAEQRVQDGYGGQFQPLDAQGLFQEMRTLIAATELSQTIFRSDHVSNRLVLKGVLGKDKARMLTEIDQAIEYAQSRDIPLYQGRF